MKKFNLEYGNDNPTVIEFLLEDNPVAELWAQQIQQSKVIHAGSADTPTDLRIKFQWQLLYDAISIVNYEHLTDEWIQVPKNFPADNWQTLCNEIRLKGQVYEIYAGHHQLNTKTRQAFNDLASIICSLENTVNSVDSMRGTWFKWEGLLEVPDSGRRNGFTAGSIVAVQPAEIRTINEARRANDKAVVQRNLLKSWTTTNRAFLALTDFEEDTEKNNHWIQSNNLTEKMANYTSTYFSLAKLITPLTEAEKVGLLRSKLERIVFQ